MFFNGQVGFECKGVAMQHGRHGLRWPAPKPGKWLLSYYVPKDKPQPTWTHYPRDISLQGTNIPE